MRWVTLFVVLISAIFAVAVWALDTVAEPAGEDETVSESAGKEREVPQSRGGRDMVGAPLDLGGLAWLNTEDVAPVGVEGKVTLVRWWTETCPYCAGSLPAIDTLRERYGDDGLQTVAVYHAKPPRPVDDADVLEKAKAFGYKGIVAKDANWAVLKREYLLEKRRSATSVAFILDGEGVVRFVHPGPAFWPSDDPGDGAVDQDYREVEEAVQALVAELES